MTTFDEGLKLAIEWAGGMRALARQLGFSHTAIQKWDRVPAEHVVEIEAITGIARERLRPDLYRMPPMTRSPYYPGASIWQHPNAEACFANLNRMRTVVYGGKPLERDTAYTEDVLREHLKADADCERQLNRLSRRNGSQP